jgi:hypothetical protein
MPAGITTSPCLLSEVFQLHLLFSSDALIIARNTSTLNQFILMTVPAEI